MATITSVGSGAWGTAGTWDGGVPANGDSVVIAAGHTVTFNVDQSGFAAGIAGLTLGAGAVLVASTTAGNYYLKMAGNITASGAGAELRAGTVGTAYPSNCTFTILMNGNYSIDGGASNYLTCKFYCYDPPVKYLRLISATPKAITGISKGTTCTVTCVGHGYSGGDTIYLVNVGGMVELNNLRVKVKTVLGADSFTIRAYDADVVIDSTAFTTYTTGGYACPETAEAAGQTQLEVDQDVSADAEWTRSGATVNIDNVARAQNSESRTLASVASGSVTVTAGLTAAKHSSSLVILTSRNVTVNTSSTAVTNGVVYRGSGHVLGCALKSGSASSYLSRYGTSITFSGVASGSGYVNRDGNQHIFSGVFSGMSYLQSGGLSHSVTGVCSGILTGALCGTKFSSISGVVSGCGDGIRLGSFNIFTGTATGCDYAIEDTTDCYISGKILGCGTGIAYSGCTLVNACLNGNQSDVRMSVFESHNTYFGSSVENNTYNTAQSFRPAISESFDHDQIAGAFRAWTRGGITSSTETDPPISQVRSYQHVCESATYPCWRRWPIWVEPGRTLRLRVWLKADVGVEIKAQLVLPTADPLITGTGTGEWQQIGTSDTAWHEYITAWTNSATYPVLIEARALATAASGNGYSQIQYAFDRSPLRR